MPLDPSLPLTEATTRQFLVPHTLALDTHLPTFSPIHRYISLHSACEFGSYHEAEASLGVISNDARGRGTEFELRRVVRRGHESVNMGREGKIKDRERRKRRCGGRERGCGESIHAAHNGSEITKHSRAKHNKIAHTAESGNRSESAWHGARNCVRQPCGSRGTLTVQGTEDRKGKLKGQSVLYPVRRRHCQPNQCCNCGTVPKALKHVLRILADYGARAPCQSCHN